MALQDSAAEAALDRFGRDVIVAARDESIWWHDANVRNANRQVSEQAPPETKQVAADYAALGSLSPEMRAVVRRVVVLAGDSAIYFVLKYLDELEAKLVVDDIEILHPVRGVLHSMQSTDEG